MFEEFLLIILGLTAGILGSLIGLGGGVTVVTVLTILGFPPTVAASNSLFGGLSNAISSSLIYAKQKKIEYKIGIKIGLLSIPGTVLGAIVSDDITPTEFKILFAILLVSSSIYIFTKRKIEQKEKFVTKQISIFIVAVSFIGGIISSLFGIGGGIIFVPLMILVVGLKAKIAAPTSQFILLFAATSGIITHSILGHPDYYHSLWLSIGTFVGGLLGARLSLDIKENILKMIVSLVIVAIAIKFLLDSLGIVMFEL